MCLYVFVLDATDQYSSYLLNHTMRPGPWVTLLGGMLLYLLVLYAVAVNSSGSLEWQKIQSCLSTITFRNDLDRRTSGLVVLAIALVGIAVINAASSWTWGERWRAVVALNVAIVFVLLELGFIPVRYLLSFCQHVVSLHSWFVMVRIATLCRHYRPSLG